MEDLNWKTGPGVATQEDSQPGKSEMEFWKSLLSNHSLRSRFIRNLEIQSIGSRTTEELLHRTREEEILPRGGGRN